MITLDPDIAMLSATSTRNIFQLFLCLLAFSPGTLSQGIYQPINSIDSLGGTKSEHAFRLTPDPINGTYKYLAGIFQSPILSSSSPSTVAPVTALQNVTTPDAEGALLLKIRHLDNAVIWALAMGGDTGENRGFDVAVSLDGAAVYVVGEF